MKIETKYNIGDKVFFLNYYKNIVQEKIDYIDISVRRKFLSFGNTPEVNIKYFIGSEVIEEERCFKTKEELLKSL